MTTEKQISRNEACPCGSGKKYKRCHGVNAAPVINAPKAPAWGGADGGMGAGMMGGAGAAGMMSGMPTGPGGMPFDPSQLDPAMMMQFTQALQRLPKGQLQRLQSIMQKAMSGKDVSREAAELERSLPPDFQNLMTSFSGMATGMGGMPGMGGAGADFSGNTAGDLIDVESTAGVPADMTPEKAREIIEAAAKEGKLSASEAESLLSGTENHTAPDKESEGKMSKFWKSITGKNESAG